MNVGLKETECGEEMKSNSEAKWTVLWQIPLFGAAVIAWVAFVIYAIHDGGTTRDGAASAKSAVVKAGEVVVEAEEGLGSGGTRDAEGAMARVCEEGGVLRAGAEKLVADADELRGRGQMREARGKEETARVIFGRAARLFVQVVRDVESDKELHRRGLEQACDCRDASRDYTRAAVYYRLILKCTSRADETTATRLRYARVLQALGEDREALREIGQCVASAGNAPSVYEAMLARSQSCVAMGDLAGAEKALTGIVSREDALSPGGRMWGDAVSRLGWVLYREGKFGEATEKFEEALSRNVGVDSEGLNGRAMAYYAAESYRNMGSVQPAARRAELTAAARWYAEVRKCVGNEESVRAVEERMIRRSYLSEAECRCQAGGCAEGLRLYEEVAEKYLETSEGVGALYGAAACRHELGDAAGAIEALKKAKWGLERLKKNDPGQVGAFQEERWGAMCAWSIGGEGS